MKFLSQTYTAVSGSIGGITYANNKGGMYARGRGQTTNPSSPRQIAQRMYFADAIEKWTNLLTPTQREDWNSYAANVPLLDTLGQSRFVSGQNHYVRVYIATMLAGEDGMLASEAPVQYDLGTPGTIGITSVAGTGVVTLSIIDTTWSFFLLGHLLVFGGIQQNPSVSFYKGPFRFLGTIQGDDAVNPVTGTVDLDNANPPLMHTTGRRIWIRIAALTPDGDDRLRYSNGQILGPILIS
jgi:hypothetical protein